MGVNPTMKNYYKERNIKPWIYKRLYNSKFHSVVATQDGSGTERWMKKAININSNQYILINGVNKEKINTKKNHSNIINFCFIGKLEKQKGINEFINTAIKFLNEDKRAKFTIVGDGSLFEEILSKISINNFQKEIDLIRHLDHRKIYNLLNRIDVYISLNKYGNLSNTNLEAISLNKAMIILDSDKELEIDLFVDEFLPQNSVIRIDRNNIEESLFKAFVKISENKRVVSNLSKNIKPISNKLESWEDRIIKEIKIILKAYERKT
jgi:glycosyltransferase involved in cell wall biosynthesis